MELEWVNLGPKISGDCKYLGDWYRPILVNMSVLVDDSAFLSQRGKCGGSAMAEKPTRPQTDQRWMLHWCGDRLEDVPEEDDHWAKRWGVAPCCTIRTMCILSFWCENYYGSSLITQYITVRIVLNHLPPLKVKHGDHLTQEAMCHFIFTNSRTRGYWCEEWESPYVRQLRQNYTMSDQVSHSWLLANLIWQM